MEDARFRRRQHRCCDPCRKAKRACDAPIGLPLSQQQPCSNCTKWRKDCTFEWLSTVRCNDAMRKGFKKRKIKKPQESPRTSDAALENEPGDELLLVDDLAESHTRLMVTRDLLRIYHDSIEHALSCWLTERTCPYSTYFQPTRQTQLQRVPNICIDPEWGPNWSNRICSRVCRLDRAYASVRGRHLTATEERAVARALHSTIMAFAMQWKKEQHRTLQWSPVSQDAVDRRARESWHNANHALQACANVESIRVVFAYIIFSLTHRPLAEREDVARLDGGTDISQLSQHLQQLLDTDEAPIFLETGIRRLLAFHYKIKRVQRSARGDALFNPQDHETFNLLYWLGVMLDTVTAATYGRPLVVSDEDSSACPLLPRIVRLDSPMAASTPPSASVWGELFLRCGSLVRSQQVPSWPCSYERAAVILADGAPIKLLMFRRIARLQLLLYREANGNEIEALIDETTRVLRFWSQTYGRFVRECMAHHDELPPRIQSWYVIVAGHWHLAAMFVAETVAEIDEAALGLDHRCEARRSASFASHLRIEHAVAASDLARVCVGENPRGFLNDARPFHDLFQAGVVLTEPWMILLVRLFIKTALIFLGALSERDDEVMDSSALRETVSSDLRQRCIYCIDALKCLGQMSDVACLAARMLARHLDNTVSRERPPIDIDGHLSWELDLTSLPVVNV